MELASSIVVQMMRLGAGAAARSVRGSGVNALIICFHLLPHARREKRRDDHRVERAVRVEGRALPRRTAHRRNEIFQDEAPPEGRERNDLAHGTVGIGIEIDHIARRELEAVGARKAVERGDPRDRLFDREEA